MTDTSTPPPRVPGRTGRLPALQGDARLPIPWFHEVFQAALAPATYPLDVTGGRQIEWLMLGNGPDATLTVSIPGQPDLAGSGCGDCFFAGVGHDEILAGGTVNADGTVSLYFSYDQNQDLGVVVANALLWLYQQGIVKLFAPVHPDNADSVMQLVGRGVLVGANLTPADMGNFNQSPPLPWEVTPSNQPDPNEGHVVYKVKSAGFEGDGAVITWGAEQPVKASWLAQQPAGAVEELWVILTATDQDKLPADQWNRYVAALDALPGATGPTPAPAPAPAPTPPVPPPAPVGPPPPDPHLHWWQELQAWYEDLLRWLEKWPGQPPAQQ